MFLSELTIKNFRNFENLTIDFSPGLNVIVGENNIGKTNLFDAIRITLGGASNQGEFVRATKDDLSKDKFGNIIGNSFQISLIFSGLTEDERGEFIDILELNADEPELSQASVHFHWTWLEDLGRGTYRRWGGVRSNTDNMPDDILQSIQITLLKALRDALSGLQPGRASQLGRLLRVSAKDEQKTAIEAIITKANEKLESDTLIKEVTDTIQSSLTNASGEVLSQKPSISTSPAEFDRISNNLRIAIQREKETPESKPILEELWFNGLGYNNLLFIATVLSELEAAKSASLSLLLVEEPEAHLHPQLQILLADYLSSSHTSEDDKHCVQTFVTTHSPTIAAHVDPDCLIVLNRTKSGVVKSTSIRSCGLTVKERKQLQRMLDVTKATMLFSRGVVLVEGISEALLLPVLAKRLKIRIVDSAVTIIPICGVDFATFGKLFRPDRIAMNLAIITDGDPKRKSETENKETTANKAAPADTDEIDSNIEEQSDEDEPEDPAWESKIPVKDNGKYEPCKRTQTLFEQFKTNDCVSVFHSEVTLEFDLANAGENNAEHMCEAWHDCFEGTPRTLNRKRLKACTNKEQRVLTVWRGICVAKPKAGKPEFAQSLAMRLDEKTKDGQYKLSTEDFVIPKYLCDALSHAMS